MICASEVLLSASPGHSTHPGILLALLALESWVIKKRKWGQSATVTQMVALIKGLCSEVLTKEVCSWPPWAMVLAENQQKYGTIGNQCILTLPCGVLYNEIALCTFTR